MSQNILSNLVIMHLLFVFFAAAGSATSSPVSFIVRSTVFVSMRYHDGNNER